jgi:hypothetical protein
MDPNEKLTGIASMMPQGGPPMGPPPGMGGGQPSIPMGGGGLSPMPMGGEEPPMDSMMGGEEPPMNVEQDAMMLAEAVVGRTQGDVQSAIDVLDTAKAMLMSSGSQEPQMMMDGGPMYAKMGKPLYAKGGGGISNSDIMRQMIMDDIKMMDGGPMYAAEGKELNPGLQALQKERPDVVKKILGKADGGSIENQMDYLRGY